MKTSSSPKVDVTENIRRDALRVLSDNAKVSGNKKEMESSDNCCEDEALKAKNVNSTDGIQGFYTCTVYNVHQMYF